MCRSCGRPRAVPRSGGRSAPCWKPRRRRRTGLRTTSPIPSGGRRSSLYGRVKSQCCAANGRSSRHCAGRWRPGVFPSRSWGLGGLLTVPEVLDVVSVLRVLEDTDANPSLLRLLTGQRLRLGPSDLVALGGRARVLAASPTGTDLSPTGSL